MSLLLIKTKHDQGPVFMQHRSLDGVDFGERRVVRVSRVEFDHKDQVWKAIDAFDDQLLAAAVVRDEVIFEEHKLLQKKRVYQNES